MYHWNAQLRWLKTGQRRSTQDVQFDIDNWAVLHHTSRVCRWTSLVSMTTRSAATATSTIAGIHLASRSRSPVNPIIDCFFSTEVRRSSKKLTSPNLLCQSRVVKSERLNTLLHKQLLGLWLGSTSSIEEPRHTSETKPRNQPRHTIGCGSSS